MKIEINGQRVIGLDSHVLKAIVGAICGNCLHKAMLHTETGCQAVECSCRKGFTSYVLMTDDDFIQSVITEGLF